MTFNDSDDTIRPRTVVTGMLFYSVCGILISVLFLAVAALVISVSGLNESSFLISALLCAFMGAAFAGHLAARHFSFRKMLAGLGVGLTMFVLLFLIGIVSVLSFPGLKVSMLLMLPIILGGAILGAATIGGLGIRKRHRRKNN